MKAKHRKQKT